MGENNGQKDKAHKSDKNTGHLFDQIVGVDTCGYGKSHRTEKKDGAFGDNAKIIKQSGDGEIYPLGGNEQSKAQRNVHVKLVLESQAYLAAHNHLKNRQHQKKQSARGLSFLCGNGFWGRAKYNGVTGYFKTVALENFGRLGYFLIIEKDLSVERAYKPAVVPFIEHGVLS